MNMDRAQDTTSKETAASTEEQSAPSNESRSLDGEYADESELDESEVERRKRKKAGVVGDAVVCRPLEVSVREDRVEQAIRQLKNRMARDGVLRELKNRRHYFKPSELKRIKRREAARRRRKQARQVRSQ